ncbi:MAG: hypothetical protein ACOH18_01725 [Candidatus Saccharimonadaceae bacterium]
MPKRIGLDVGGVIIDAIRNDGTDTDLRGDNFMKTTAVTGVFDAVKRLVELYGSDNIFIVSKCGEVIEGKTRMWLAGNDFYAYTGFNPDNLYFCRTRAAKAPIVQELRLTDFVDDHADVLEYMLGIVANRYLFGPQDDEAQNTDGLIAVSTWEKTLDSILQKV